MKKVRVVGVVVFVICAVSSYAQKTNILVITGGHEFDHRAFYALFDAMDGIRYDTLVQPKANALIASGGVDRYDVLVFYDMFDKISLAEQNAYKQLLQRGKAMIFLHHALVSYQEWPEYIRIVGGQYYTTRVVVRRDTIKGNYEHDVLLPVKVVDRGHAITDGIDDFEILDERYGGSDVLGSVKALLTTTHPNSMKPLAWINHYGNSDVVYIQLGHGPTAYSNVNYRRLIRQAILWSAGRHRK